MKCADCPYFWKEDWEDHPQCHWVSRCPDDFPPCEEEDFASDEQGIDYYDDEYDYYYDEELYQ